MHAKRKHEMGRKKQDVKRAEYESLLFDFRFYHPLLSSLVPLCTCMIQMSYVILKVNLAIPFGFCSMHFDVWILFFLEFLIESFRTCAMAVYAFRAVS